MRKASAVGLVIGVLFLAVVFGIASIPDEVLESNSIEKSDGPIITIPQGPPTAEPEIPHVAEPETPQVAEPEIPQVAEPETPQVAEPETYSEESEGNIFRVEINDGVGSADK